MKEYFKLFVQYLIIASIITIIWQCYESVFIGEIKADAFDTIITIVLSYVIILVRIQQKEIKQQRQYRNRLILAYNEYKESTEKLVSNQQKLINLYKEKQEKKPITENPLFHNLVNETLREMEV